MDMDFGYSQNNNHDNNGSGIEKTEEEKVTNISTGELEGGAKGGDSVNINSESAKVDEKESKLVEKLKEEPKEKETTSVDLQPGTFIEIGDETYSVDENGNILDKNGNIYKEASEVDEWIKSFEAIEDNSKQISIESIQAAVGVDIIGDNDKPIKFDNTPDGVKAYVDAVIDSAKEEHFTAAINTLYQKYPILNDVLNYYVANGNSLEGFGEIPDRSNITVDDTNEVQQEAIIRTAWNERGQKGDLDGYLAYLKSSGTLLATAKEELAALQESDVEYREQMAAKAKQAEEERLQTLENYWIGVHDVIKSRSIAGYQIPESIIVNRNGQKLSVTPEDFFNYIYRVDKNGQSAYERDLLSETPESRRDDEILRAYLKFVGGNYSNLVDMAINKEKVNKLKFRAKERMSTQIRIKKPTNINNSKDIDFGYN